MITNQTWRKGIHMVMSYDTNYGATRNAIGLKYLTFTCKLGFIIIRYYVNFMMMLLILVILLHYLVQSFSSVCHIQSTSINNLHLHFVKYIFAIKSCSMFLNMGKGRIYHRICIHWIEIWNQLIVPIVS